MSGDVALLGPHALHGLIGGGASVSFASSSSAGGAAGVGDFADVGSPVTVQVGSSGRLTVTARVTGPATIDTSTAVGVTFRLSGANTVTGNTMWGGGYTATWREFDDGVVKTTGGTLTGLTPGETTITVQAIKSGIGSASSIQLVELDAVSY